MVKNKKQHTISACYLEGFTDARGFNWVLDQNGKIYSSKPTEIFTQNHFYTITLQKGGGSLVVENTLQDFETSFAAIFQNKIRSQNKLTTEEKGKVAVFVAAMMNRTEPARNQLRKMLTSLDGALGEWKKQFDLLKEKEEFQKTMAAMPATQGKTLSRNDIKNAIENVDEIHSATLLNTLPHIANTIFQMNWVFIEAPEGRNFFTSDHPFCVCRPESIKKYGSKAFGSLPGLKYSDAEVTIPLSSKIALLAGWKLERDGEYMKADEAIFKSISTRALFIADRVVSSEKETLEAIKSRKI